MADKREDPLVVYKFGLEIEGKLAGYFSSVSGIGSETQVIVEKAVNHNTGEAIEIKVPGRTTWTDVTLKIGVTSNRQIWNWRKEVVAGNVNKARTNCSIIAYSQDNKEVARWNFANAWPSKVTGPNMDAGSTDFMVEELTIVHEGMERVA